MEFILKNEFSMQFSKSIFFVGYSFLLYQPKLLDIEKKCIAYIFYFLLGKYSFIDHNAIYTKVAF